MKENCEAIFADKMGGDSSPRPIASGDAGFDPAEDMAKEKDAADDAGHGAKERKGRLGVLNDCPDDAEGAENGVEEVAGEADADEGEKGAVQQIQLLFSHGG